MLHGLFQVWYWLGSEACALLCFACFQVSSSAEMNAAAANEDQQDTVLLQKTRMF